MAYALRALGKEVEVITSIRAASVDGVPGVPDIRIAPHATANSRAIIMECGDLARTGSASRAVFVVNIDHHPGNSGYGQINWFDPGAAACGEMVFDVVRALGVR